MPTLTNIDTRLWCRVIASVLTRTPHAEWSHTLRGPLDTLRCWGYDATFVAEDSLDAPIVGRHSNSDRIFY